MRKTPLSCAVIVFALNSAVLAEYLVNTRTTGNQTDPAVAVDSRGNHLIVWSSYNQDGDSGGIFAQRFDPNCSLLGGEFQVNARTIGNQTDPHAAMHQNGAFIVAWHGPGTADQDIYAQRFDTDAQPAGDEFRVNTAADLRQRYPRVALSRSGYSVIVWETERPAADDTAWRAAGRLYDSNSTPVGNEFWPSQIPDSRYPDAAMDADGNFVVVWVQDTGSKSIMARLYDTRCRPKTDPFVVNSIACNSLTTPAVAMQTNGSFVVTWDGDEHLSSLDDIHARAFDPNGEPVSEQFMVNNTRAYAQQNPDISMTEQGEFVIVWHSESIVQNHARDIFARRYGPACLPIGDEIRLNSFASNEQKYPAVAISQNAKFIAVWQSDGQDGSGYGIFATTNARICPADFSDDGFVNFFDYCIIADEWLAPGDTIDSLDLAEFCHSWLDPCRQCRLGW
ncbi:MAG: hypothetical protein JW720_03190 [Sedimentisphaerales bacterium]|nr:hypothetical protein [Sedimentisphaerales bacterium]